jgi:hypothetical protein
MAGRLSLFNMGNLWLGKLCWSPPSWVYQLLSQMRLLPRGRAPKGSREVFWSSALSPLCLTSHLVRQLDPWAGRPSCSGKLFGRRLLSFLDCPPYDHMLSIRVCSRLILFYCPIQRHAKDIIKECAPLD